MRCFLTDISSFQIWFGDQQVARCATPLESVPEFSQTTARKAGLPLDQLKHLGLTGPLHLAVPDRNSRTFSSGIVSHVLSNPPPRSFVRISRDIYALAPIPTLIMIAPRIPREVLLRLIYQLLGTYRISDGELRERKPLATLNELRTYLASTFHMRGMRQVEALLRYAIEGIASPEEGRVACLLFLPPKWGGRGLPLAESNARIVISSDKNASNTVRYADFFWRLWNLILEYDSDAFHTGSGRIGRDNARRSQLQAAGYTVVTLTNRQLHTADEFEDVVDTLLRAMRRNSKTKGDAGFPEREGRLRRTLYRFDIERELGV